MYKKVSSDMNFVPREEEVLVFWEKNKIFEKSVEQNKGKTPYTFYDGPPTANGKPHIGHVLTRAIKDLIPRHRAMKGYDVLRKAGWDTHGLPVELEVEKQLGLKNKQDIEKYGVEKFIEKCKESVWKYQSDWERLSERVGYWVDMEDPYVTYHNDYIESEWWALKKIFDMGLLYKGHKTVPYCPRCGTSLSSHEVAQGYKDVVDDSLTVRFKAKDGDYSFLAWTTTPWTLPSNVALCVNPNVEYCLVESKGEKFILAEGLIEKILGEDARILEKYTGSELVGREYEPLFSFTAEHAAEHAAGKRGWYITEGNYVTLNDGTGIVHIAPAFGEDDSLIGKEYDLPFVQLVDEGGNMIGGTPWDGMFVKDADAKIIEDLKNSGKLFSIIPYEHSYPFCWRCDTPLIYYARASWFIQMTAVKDKLLKFNNQVNWIPENIKKGRMGNFLENVIDWGLSRERYWGTPLPIWICDDCETKHAIGSIQELKEMGDDVPDDIELHKPYIDRVVLNCPKCSGKMHRVPEVVDGWFDSGSMPFAQWHYPFENKETFDLRYPANFISEAVDQTRGWFYTLLAISTLLMDEPAFENCIVMGHVQDQEGKKMSKHLGNVVDPWSVLDVQGADAIRWYFYTSSMPWLPSRFSSENVAEFQRKFMGTFWNTYYFYVLYADIDGFDPSKHDLIDENLSAMDKWVLSRLNSAVKKVDSLLDDLKLTEAGRELQDFVDDASNWYVRLCRERYWGKSMTADKEAAYMTLYTVLETTMRAAAPFVPFMTESMHQNMVRPFFKESQESVHLCRYPQGDESRIDVDLEENMAKVRDIVVLGRAARNSSGIKNRQPLSALYTNSSPLPSDFAEIVSEELNIKRVMFTDDTSEYTTYNIKPQLRTMGPKYGKHIGKINDYLKSVDGNEVVSKFDAGEEFAFEIDGETITMSKDDALIELTQKEGYIANSENGLTVVLDGNMTPELIEEGFVREIVSKIQTMRKDAGFDVVDHISIASAGNETIAEIIARNSDLICSDTLADNISTQLDGFEKKWDINGENVVLSVKKL